MPRAWPGEVADGKGQDRRLLSFQILVLWNASKLEGYEPVAAAWAVKVRFSNKFRV